MRPRSRGPAAGSPVAVGLLVMGLWCMEQMGRGGEGAGLHGHPPLGWSPLTPPWGDSPLPSVLPGGSGVGLPLRHLMAVTVQNGKVKTLGFFLFPSVLTNVPETPPCPTFLPCSCHRRALRLGSRHFLLPLFRG